MVNALTERCTGCAACSGTGQASEDGPGNRAAQHADRPAEGACSGTEFRAGQRSSYRAGAARRCAERASDTACKVAWRSPDRVARGAGVDCVARIGAVGWDGVFGRAGRLLLKPVAMWTRRPMLPRIVVVLVEWWTGWVMIRHGGVPLTAGRG